MPEQFNYFLNAMLMLSFSGRLVLQILSLTVVLCVLLAASCTHHSSCSLLQHQHPAEITNLQMSVLLHGNRSFEAIMKAA
jgi:hypothetical protein